MNVEIARCLNNLPIQPTQTTKLVYEFADHETESFLHENLGTSHILLGIMQTNWGKSYFEDLPMDPRFYPFTVAHARSRLELISRKTDQLLVREKCLKRFSPRAEWLTRIATLAAQVEKRNSFDTVDLLIGITRLDDDSGAMRILNGLGAMVDKMANSEQLSMLRSLEQQFHSDQI